jgi:uncharacterized damage-inducible protein DinB
MSAAEQEEMERVLREGAEALAEALRDVEDGIAAMRPRPDAWSILQCVEHIALTERGLLECLREAKPAEASHADPLREARFQDLALNRARRIEAPALVVPGRACDNLQAARNAFDAARSETLRFIAEFDGDLRSWLTLHPLITRPVNCYEMLLLIALHPRRHAQQILEIREQLAGGRSPI